MNVWNSIFEFFDRQTKAWLLIEAVLLVGAIGLVDYITGYEVTFYPFYSAPILLTLWFAGKSSAFGVATLSGIAWLIADTAAGHVYVPGWLKPWDFLVRLIFFYLVVIAGAEFRKRRDESQSQIRLLEHTQKLEQQIINISEREQQRIGRDLHDGLGQHLVAIGLAADSLKEDLEKESPESAKAVGQLAELIHDAVSSARNLAHGLSPLDEDEGALESALGQLAASISRLSKVTCEFRCPMSINIRDNDCAVHLFRIAQEAVNNALKHSEARSIVISLEVVDRRLVLSVSDNGWGFDPEEMNFGMGLSIMKYRARVMGGTLTITGRQPCGTEVACVIDPFPAISSSNAL